MPQSLRSLIQSFCFVLFLSLALGISGSCIRANAQQPATNIAEDRDRGAELYKKGDTKGAIEALRIAVKQRPDDIRAWHYLGLALEQKGDTGSARKAYGKAAKLGDKALESQLNQQPNDKETGRALMSIRSKLVEAAESAEKYLALNSKPSRSKREE